MRVGAPRKVDVTKVSSVGGDGLVSAAAVLAGLQANVL